MCVHLYTLWMQYIRTYQYTRNLDYIRTWEGMASSLNSTDVVCSINSITPPPLTGCLPELGGMEDGRTVNFLITFP